MVEHNPPAAADSVRPRVIPLPVALYVSDELIFELYAGLSPVADFRYVGKGWFQGRTASQRRPPRVPKRACAHTKIRDRIQRQA
jgi:hypothetical protein